MTREAGLFLKDTEEEVALQGVKIEAEIRDLAAKTIISQRYKNTEKKSIEAVYCFPMEEGAAIYNLKVVIDDREIEAVAEEKEKAFETYDKAIEKGDGAFLLDQEESDVFVLSVGNLKPDQEVVIIIEYATVLAMTDETIRLQIPTTVSPRYIPIGSDPVKADAVSPPYAATVPYGLTLAVTIADMDLMSVSSPSHPVTVEDADDGKRVSLSNREAALDRDFTLEIKPRDAGEPICLVSKHANGDEAAMVRFYPEFDEEDFDEATRCDLLFILDCSGSMHGSSIEEAKTALELCLRSLNEGDMFNIIRFGSAFEPYAKEPVIFNEKNLNKVMKYVKRIEADLGGTELFETLKHACAIPVSKECRRDVILLTDGEVFNAGDIINHVTKSHGKSRFYTFGIGYGASHALIRGLARATKGAYEMIQPGEAIEEKVLRQFSRLVQPALDDVEITVSNGEFDFQDELPPVYEGDAFTAFAGVKSFTKDTVLTLSGTLPSGKKSWTCKLKDLKTDNTVPVLRAANRIKYLEDHRDTEADKHPSSRRSRRMHSELLDLALSYNLMSSETSFVAIEKRKKTDKTFDPDYRRIPVMITKDYGADMDMPLLAGAMPAAASAAPRMMNCHSMVAPQMMSKSRGAPRGLLSKSAGIVSSFASGITDLFAGSRQESSYADAMPESADFLAEDSVDYDLEEAPLPTRESQSEWYIEILKTQQVNGCFEATDIVADKLDLSAAELVKRIEEALKQHQASDRKLLTQAVITVLAVQLINDDPKAKAICTRATKKAETWLKKQACQVMSEETLNMIAANLMG